MSEIFPEGIDVYFDNVGGEILDDILSRIRMHGRIILSGAISGYISQNFHPLRNYTFLTGKRARMEGFIVTDFYERYEEAYNQLKKWVLEGRSINNFLFLITLSMHITIFILMVCLS